MLHMNLSPRGIAFIKQWEACRLIAYRDGKGVWTIGWGHTGPNIVNGTRWSQKEADDAFVHDTVWAVTAVNKALTTDVTQAQFDALVAFTFNVGEPNLRISTLLRKVNGRDFVGAGAQFRRWNKLTLPDGRMKADKGLTNRRAAETELFFTNDQ